MLLYLLGAFMLLQLFVVSALIKELISDMIEMKNYIDRREKP